MYTINSYQNNLIILPFSRRLLHFKQMSNVRWEIVLLSFQIFLNNTREERQKDYRRYPADEGIGEQNIRWMKGQKSRWMQGQKSRRMEDRRIIGDIPRTKGLEDKI